MRAALRFALFGILSGVLACSRVGGQDPAEISGDFAAPPSIRATLVLEPAELEIGEVTVVKLAVVTPPDVQVLPIAPVELPGLWLLGIRSLPLDAGEERWIHRTEFRVRPRALGTHTWPEMNVKIETNDGSVESLTVPPRTFEVMSVKNRFPADQAPFGVEPLPESMESDGSFRAGLVTGLGVSFALLLCAFGVRRAVAHRAEQNVARAVASRAQPEISLAAWSRRELQRALEAVDHDPHEAANEGAQLLRIYMARRYGGGTEAATTEELGRRTPTLAQRSVWPDFVGILQGFDDLRFRPNIDGTERRRRTRRALEDAVRLVDASAGDVTGPDPRASVRDGGRDARGVPQSER